MPCAAKLAATPELPARPSRAHRAGRNGATRLGIILGIAVIARLLSVGVATAANQGTSTTSLSAGSSVATACGSGVTASYTTAYASAIPGYDISQVNLDNIPAGCLRKAYKIQLTGASGIAVGSELTGTLPATGTTANIATSGTPDASLVIGISVVIA